MTAKPMSARSPLPASSGATLAITVVHALSLSLPVWAQSPVQSTTSSIPTPSYPTSQQIEVERARIDGERKAMFSDDNPHTRNTPNTFPTIAAPQPSQIDIEALVRRYEGTAQPRGVGDDLMVFASFSMPTESLKQLVSTVAKVGGSVVLRGFKNNSYRQTVQAIAALGEASASVSIHPKAFAQYKITAVPAFVIARLDPAEQLDAQGCALPETYAAIAGDVSLDYALAEIAKRSPAMSDLAQRYLRQLGKGGASDALGNSSMGSLGSVR